MPKEEVKAQSEPIIEVRDLVGGYEETVILDGVSFDIRRGEIFSILGGSGCGKTTLLRYIVGLLEPFSGDVLIKGRSIVNADEKELDEIRRSFGVMYQSGALFGSMTVMENLALQLEEFSNLPREAIELICLGKLKLVGLEGSEDLMPAELSGGMIKRVAIARAMVFDAEIIFLDEPSAGLDPITSAEIDELIKSLSRLLGITFVLVTHELESILNVSDRVIVLDKSKKGIVETGDPRQLKEHSKNQFVHNFFNRKPG
ncbi:putative ABC transporter ATP-binding protein [Limihaloglobus sulfuriphilus]|uniref:Putative ABC transporter ATP-binding protein n=1 Tax=Limihaloglobus sulfuriphilus TaxID=1851148 RepID=A0A1Q2MC82_9BACT|nr:ATP-binding cassette domain-containing protein [Limihaloglobus sulfuriphilus]AQQ70270.1 putative ABC transporter ATP-binding protein [Limihaloglobus sulfuriphilus]